MNQANQQLLAEREAAQQQASKMSAELTQQLEDLTRKYQELDKTCQALRASEEEREGYDSQNSAVRQLTSQLSTQLHEMTGTC